MLRSAYRNERNDQIDQLVRRVRFRQIDRQQGVVASGRFGKGTAAELSYWAGWLSGAGRGSGVERADGLWLGRLQWNLGGRVLDFSQSALGRPEQPEGSIAIAAVSGKSAYTAFSSAGGGQLPGFEEGDSNRYRLEQWLFETAYQHGGYSWQQEFHWKRIDDRQTGRRSRLTGGYAQAGVFADAWFDAAPEPLEIALRYSRVDPDKTIVGDEEQEWTLAGNWFFNGHRNKLTLDLSYLTQVIEGVRETSNRIRFQWDVSF